MFRAYYRSSEQEENRCEGLLHMHIASREKAVKKAGICGASGTQRGPRNQGAATPPEDGIPSCTSMTCPC